MDGYMLLLRTLVNIYSTFLSSPSCSDLGWGFAIRTDLQTERIRTNSTRIRKASWYCANAGLFLHPCRATRRPRLRLGFAIRTDLQTEQIRAVPTRIRKAS